MEGLTKLFETIYNFIMTMYNTVMNFFKSITGKDTDTDVDDSEADV